MNTLTWTDLRRLGCFDNANRYHPTHPVCLRYIKENGYRSPSRAYPYSYAKPLMTQKFAKWLAANNLTLD